MIREIKKRLKRLEQRIWTKLPLWPDDSDGFLAALGVDNRRYAVTNPNGSTGFDTIRALSDLAAEDWKE